MNTPNESAIRAVVLTSSDRCSHGLTRDLSGPAVATFVRERLHGEVVHVEITPDDPTAIAEFLRRWSDPLMAIDLALVTGGTGLGPRDFTPEAAMQVIDRPHPGLMELARARCGADHPRAFLSRGVAGATNSTLILTLPGSPKGAVETLEALLDILPHAVRMLRGSTAPQAHA